MAARPLRTREAKFRTEAECGQNFSSPFVVASRRMDTASTDAAWNVEHNRASVNHCKLHATLHKFANRRSQQKCYAEFDGWAPPSAHERGSIQNGRQRRHLDMRARTLQYILRAWLWKVPDGWLYVKKVLLKHRFAIIYRSIFGSCRKGHFSHHIPSCIIWKGLLKKC